MAKKIEVTWEEYHARRDEIWAKYCNDESLSPNERGKKIVADLDKLKVIKG